MPILVSLIAENSNNETFHIGREIVLKVTNTDVDSLKPIKPFERPKPIFKRARIYDKIEAGLKLDKVANFSLRWGFL